MKHRRSRTGGAQRPCDLLAPSAACRKQATKLEKLLAGAQLSALAGSSLTPGPMVELIDTFLMKVPLAPLGLARLIAVTSAFTLAVIASSLNDALPTPA